MDVDVDYEEDASLEVRTMPLHFASPSPISAASVTSLPGTSTTPLGAGRGNPLAKRKWLGCSPLDDFDIMEKVYKAKHRKNGKIVALKKILSRNEQEGFPITALREIKLLKSLRHPNVIEALDMAHSTGNFSSEAAKGDEHAIFMVFPYMDHDLTGLLDRGEIRFSTAQIKCYMKQLLEGLSYLHKHSILHRDIKGSNILLNNRGELRITDFGLARPTEENRTHYTPGVVTRWYRPPELLLGATEYDFKVDLWGAGCILAEMHLKKPLFPGESDIHQLELVSKLCGTPSDKTMPGLFSSLPDAGKISLPQHPRRIVGGDFAAQIKDTHAVDLIDKLLVLDPKRRLSADGALAHPWFRSPPLPALPQSLPTYPPSHEYDSQKARAERDHHRNVPHDGETAAKFMRAPHPTPQDHGSHSAFHLWSPDSQRSHRQQRPPDRSRSPHRRDDDRHRGHDHHRRDYYHRHDDHHHRRDDHHRHDRNRDEYNRDDRDRDRDREREGDRERGRIYHHSHDDRRSRYHDHDRPRHDTYIPPSSTNLNLTPSDRSSGHHDNHRPSTDNKDRPSSNR